MTARAGSAPMEFVLNREPVGRAEEPVFEGALAAEGLDRGTHVPQPGGVL